MMESERTLRNNEDTYMKRHIKKMWEDRKGDDGEYQNAGTAAGKRWSK